MRVLFINGSPNTTGNTAKLAAELLKGHEYQTLNLTDYTIGAYGQNLPNDSLDTVIHAMKQADTIVIGSPVYYASPAGGAISFMDRLFFSTPYIDKTMKVGASVVSCRRGGNTATFDALNKYFTICGMPVASSQYWNMVYGNTPEEVRQDKEGMQTMRTLGRNMAFLMKSIQLGKAQFGLPEKEPVTQTNFHH